MTTALVDGCRIRLSICVAIYNLESCLQAFLESLSSFASEPSFEVLLVDDASNDQSVDILKRFCFGHPYARIIQHSANFGLYRTRKTAAIAARGDYIWLVDGDDVLSQKSSQTLIGLLKTISGVTDCIFFDWREFRGASPPRWNEAKTHRIESIIGPGEFFEPLAAKHNCWRYIFKTDYVKHFYKTNTINDDFGEDFILTSSMMQRVNYSIYLRACVYLYRRQRPDAFTSGGSPSELFTRNLEFYRGLISQPNSHLNQDVVQCWALRHIAIRLRELESEDQRHYRAACAVTSDFLKEAEFDRDQFLHTCDVINDWNVMLGREVSHTSGEDLEAVLQGAQC